MDINVKQISRHLSCKKNVSGSETEKPEIDIDRTDPVPKKVTLSSKKSWISETRIIESNLTGLDHSLPFNIGNKRSSKKREKKTIKSDSPFLASFEHEKDLLAFYQTYYKYDLRLIIVSKPFLPPISYHYLL